ncbi:MAG: protein adenylyltransferase SelO [Acidimicrobiales bacterium]
MTVLPTDIPTADLGELVFDNRFSNELPADPDQTNRPRQVHHACFSRVMPTPTHAPSLLAYSREMADDLGFSEEIVGSPEFAQVFSGNALVEGMDPHAACYGGHQFGNWAGQLGDGRAITLAELMGVDGNQHMLQLKGAGPTPYSRTADGRAVLRSSVREFLCSEAMHHLGVATTRALSLCTTGDTVVRDMFYDGRPEEEPGAVVCRVAPSFIRFGSFEIFAARDEIDELEALLHHTIKHHFPDVHVGSSDAYLQMFQEIVDTTVTMVVDWQRVGFVHGVMNTDNMSIHGVTIDYGPYGWLEDYDPNWTPNTTDAAGRRYRFGNQPQIAQWNLMRLANAIYPAVGAIEPLQEALDSFVTLFEERWTAMMAAKLGLADLSGAGDDVFLGKLFDALTSTETDMTVFYRSLASVPLTGSSVLSDDDLITGLADAFYSPAEVSSDSAACRVALLGWLREYESRVRAAGVSDDERAQQMNATNPKFVLRNYLAQLAIDQAADGDRSRIDETLEVLRRPYDEQPDKAEFAAKRPEWARTRAGCSMLSCSS